MSNQNLTLLQDEEEDVVLEGSELHQALTSMGYTNFQLIPKVKMECNSFKDNLITVENLPGNNEKFSNKINTLYHYILQDDKLRREQLEIILKANILLDDHADSVNEFLIKQPTSWIGKYFNWFQFVGSTATVAFSTFILKKETIKIALIPSLIFGFSIYQKFKHWRTIKNLNYLVDSQKELHNILKQGLKILRRTYGKKSIITEVHEKSEILGSEKYNIAISLKQLMIEIFENLSLSYYQHATEILNSLPYSLRANCQLTKINENETYDNSDYDKLKSLYYSFILVQSEMIFILANAYNSKMNEVVFHNSKTNLSQIIKHITKTVTVYYSKMTKILQDYQLCEIEPIRRVFKGIPNSKWQDTYIHLDLTSQKIQQAYKEITSILEVIDLLPERNENNFQLIESITEKMDEAYKQIENARSFAEFSSLLIAKVQHKSITNVEKEIEKENLFPISDNRTVVMVDKEPEIEDEVFEEYIKEEYLKPMYENSNGSTVQNFRLDKLLEKHFMSELKEALIEKQKTMNERELKALKRMYDKMHKESSDSKAGLQKYIEKEQPISQSVPPLPILPSLPPPPPPLPPPPVLKNTIIAETSVEDIIEKRKERTPIPLPRVKMFQAENEVPDVQRFSINDCMPKLRFPPLGLAEETFLGSGENSEAEEENESINESNEDLIDN